MSKDLDLSQAEELRVSLEGEEAAEIRWRVSTRWATHRLKHDKSFVDDEDVFWWLLYAQADLELIRTAMAGPYPEFNVDEALDRTTMPDRAERRAEDAAKREQLKAEHRVKRSLRH